MNSILIALALILQPSPEPEPRSTREEGAPFWGQTSEHDASLEEQQRVQPEAREAIHSFGACVANRSTALAAETLRKDYTTRPYKTGLLRLTRVNEGCFKKRGRMRSAGLLFAGAMAEQLVERDPQPLNARLARAASQPAPKAYSASDRIAICAVLSAPDEAGKLLASNVDGSEEAAALKALAPALSACSPSTARLEANDAGLRALLALAAFRAIDGAAASASPQRN